MKKFKDLSSEEKNIYLEGNHDARNYEPYNPNKHNKDNKDLYSRGYKEGTRINIKYDPYTR